MILCHAQLWKRRRLDVHRSKLKEAKGVGPSIETTP